MKEEIQKQLNVGFILVVEYPEWLANVVPIPKNDGKRIWRRQSSLPSGYYYYRVMSSGLKKVRATYQRAASTLFHDMMHRDVEVYVDDMIVKSRGIEVDPDKIKARLDMPMPRTKKEIKGFLGRLQHISRFIARLTNICEPIFRLLIKNQPTVWNDDYHIAFEKIKEYLLSPPILVSLMSGRPLLLYLSVSDMALGCMLAHLDDSRRNGAIYYLNPLRYLFDRPALTGRLMRWLVLLIEFDIQPVDDIFPDEEFIAMTSLPGWRMDFDGATNQSRFGIGVLLISPQGDHIPRQIQGDWRTRDVKLRSYHAYLELLVRRFDDLRYTCLPRSQNRFADALASFVDIPTDVVICPLLIESRSSTYPEAAIAKERRTLRSSLCRSSDERGSCRSLWSTHGMTHASLCPKCQIHGDLIHAPPSKLHVLTSPWSFSVRHIDIIGKISLKSSSGHEFILVAIDYFTKWVEAASYVRLTSARVVSFIGSHIICRYGVPHELISYRRVHFQAEVNSLLQKYGIRHHRSFAYRPQTNRAVEAANKNVKKILRKMVEASRDWSEKLHFALWAYSTSFRTSTGTTPYSLVYGMEVILPVETEVSSLKVALEQQISETKWAQARFDQLNLLDEKRLRAADHVQAYQRKMARAFRKQVKPRPL
ncbi:hypothetical protein CK203_107722 [Vitis vinifera]|uniref:Integrase catalytic domain-containing protein n=1 Tax=Vitis vinifera TaxID=29760 RepID=A0A438CII5_VITVI|nr:hypothetical protein CK203_107722 [Vitis vinifera]